MSYSRRSKLPPLKLTVWSGAGTPTKRVVHRGLKSHVESTGSNNMASCSKNVVTEGVIQPESPLGLEQHEEVSVDNSGLLEPSHYEIETKSSIKHWTEIRKKLLTAHTEGSCMPEQSACTMCDKMAEVRCQRCGPYTFYCESCFLLHHSRINIFHVAEKWKVSNINQITKVCT